MSQHTSYLLKDDMTDLKVNGNELNKEQDTTLEMISGICKNYLDMDNGKWNNEVLAHNIGVMILTDKEAVKAISDYKEENMTITDENGRVVLNAWIVGIADEIVMADGYKLFVDDEEPDFEKNEKGIFLMSDKKSWKKKKKDI